MTILRDASLFFGGADECALPTKIKNPTSGKTGQKWGTHLFLLKADG